MWTTFAANSVSEADSSVITFHVNSFVEGVIGTPRPYSVRHDDMFTLLFVVSILLLAVIIGSYMHTIKSLIRNFFFPPTTEDADVPARVTPLLLFFATMTCVIMSLSSFVYTASMVEGSFAIKSTIAIIAIFFAAFTVYFLLKWFIYSIVNNVLFGSKKSLHWNTVYFILTAFEELLTMPLLLMVVYLGLSVEIASYCFIFVLFLNKMLSFYKSQVIFFRQKILFLQNILYFCALEMTPLLAFGGAWLMLAHILKVNY
ncbi:MAG: DUF4271 domain-containing protein [Prevotella sp.]|nr:DUF4271 domain-containing protein [Prevotella sp.]